MRTVVHGDRLAVIGGDGAIYAMEAVTWQVEPTTVKGVPNHRVFASSFSGLRLFRGPDRRTLLSEGPLSWRPGFDLVDREHRSWGADKLRAVLTYAAWWWRSAISSVSTQGRA